MVADTLIATIAILIGGYMLADGVHVMLRGRFLGTVRPGPWRLMFEALKINVFRLGPLFVAYGLLWLGLAGFAIVVGTPKLVAAALALLTLWYLPFGTALALGVLTISLFPSG